MTKPDSKEIVGTAGLLLIVAGVACWSIPAAMVIAGLMMSGYAFQTVRTTPRAATPHSIDAQGNA